MHARPHVERLALLPLVALFAACWTEANSPTTGSVVDKLVAKVFLTPTQSTVEIGKTLTLQVTLADERGSPLNQGTVAWESADSSVATVESGIVTGQSLGSTLIIATSNDKADTAAITVTPGSVANVTLTPSSLSMTPGQTSQFRATAYDATGGTIGGRTATWSTSDTNVAPISATGVVTARAAGSATIRGTIDGVPGTATVTVAPPVPSTLYVSPTSVTLNIAQTSQLTTRLTDASGNTITGQPVAWQSSDIDIATVSSSGLVTAVASGTATVTASSAGKTATSTITVAPLPIATITITPGTASLHAGQSIQLTATPKASNGAVLGNRTMAWSSANPAVATVSAAGYVTAVDYGTTTITAASEGKSGSITVSVTVGQPRTLVVSPSTSTIAPNGTVQLSASAKDVAGNDLGTQQVTWQTSSQVVATVDGSGLVTGKASGTATITAVLGRITATATVKVQSTTPTVASITVAPTTLSLSVGQSGSLSATAISSSGTPISGITFAWSSGNTSIVTVNSSGVVTAVAQGSAQITATAQGKSATASVTVTAPPPPPPPPPPGGGTVAELPRAYVNTQMVAPTGRSINVRAGDDLQAAIDQAQPGDVLLLQPGATFTGNFRLRAKQGTGWITIRTATPDGQLPPPGTRLTPKHASLLPKIQSANVAPVFQTDPGAHHYRLLGLEVAVATSSTLNYGLIRFGDSPQTAAQVPHDLILDRSYVHGHGASHLKHCVALNSANSAVIDSYLSECHGKGQDTQAIIGWNGPGPFKIVNNYLEGAGENVMFGGGDPSITNLSPSDIEFRLNHVIKPASWKGVWTVKNLFELKNARRILIEGNIFDGSWVDGQVGFAISFKSANQSGGCPWCGTQDVTFRYNRIQNASNGITISAQPQGPAVPVSRVHIAHNIMDRINVAPYNGTGRLFQLLSDIRDLVIEHNTTFGNGDLLISFASLPPMINFVFRDNVANRGNYGMKGVGTPEGIPSLTTFAPGADVRGNIIIGAPATLYPPLNFFPANPGATGFVNYGAGDYHLSSGSAYAGRATDGRDPGADIDAVLSAIQAVIVP